jgi:hypothetical protein
VDREQYFLSSLTFEASGSIARILAIEVQRVLRTSPTLVPASIIIFGEGAAASRTGGQERPGEKPKYQLFDSHIYGVLDRRQCLLD